MTMSCTRKFSWFCLLLFMHLAGAQDNFTGYWEPGLALNYGVTDTYTHNFALANRSYLIRDEAFGLTIRQFDFAHFSTLKIRDNQSIGLGLQYRFRKPIEKESGNEFRLTQQYSITSRTAAIRLGQRLRYEQRIFSALTVHRFRYRFTLDSPLQGEQLDIGEAYLVSSLESLLSVTRMQGPQYDQRIRMQLGWLLQAGVNMEVGLEYRFEDYTSATSQILFFLNSLVVTF